MVEQVLAKPQFDHSLRSHRYEEYSGVETSTALNPSEGDSDAPPLILLVAFKERARFPMPQGSFVPHVPTDSISRKWLRTGDTLPQSARTKALADDWAVTAAWNALLASDADSLRDQDLYHWSTHVQASSHEHFYKALLRWSKSFSEGRVDAFAFERSVSDSQPPTQSPDGEEGLDEQSTPNETVCAVSEESHVDSSSDQVQSADIYKRVLSALSNPDWKFRTIRGIARETGAPVSEVKAALAQMKDVVRQSRVPDKNGRALYTLRQNDETFKEKLAYFRLLLTGGES